MQQLIYKWRGRYRLLDTEREIVVGIYDTPTQARHAWEVYVEQGRVGTGLDYQINDEYATDIMREFE